MTLLNSKNYIYQKLHLQTVQERLYSNIQYYLNGQQTSFYKPLKKILKKKEFKESSRPIIFLLTYEIYNLISLKELTTNSNLGENESLIFDEWNKGDFQKEFSKLIVEKYSVKTASKKLLPSYRDNIIATFLTHIEKSKNFKNYRFNFELGDRISNKKIVIQYRDDHLISFENLDLSYLGKDKNQINRIQKSLHIIKEFSPDSFVRFKYFTNTIIPTKRSEIVSYSSQYLPGYSVINLYNRDDIDLLDDLLHENGHHHLNTYLHEEDILNEDDELIYYSPWRKELRPVRGIYHAFATFFWAFQLFKDLKQNIDKTHFTKSQKQKVAFRLCEEFLMLNYCLPDLIHCYQHKKITTKGYKLIVPLIKSIQSFQKQYKVTKKILDTRHLNKIEKLEKLLKNKRIHYKLKNRKFSLKNF
jgi:hypothetical protein